MPDRLERVFRHHRGVRSSPGTIPEHAMDPRARSPRGTAASETFVEAAVYVEGLREGARTPADALRSARAVPGGFAWIRLEGPCESRLLSLAETFSLHGLAIEDAIVAHQRPKLEHYGDTLFLVLRAADYLDEEERLDFGELHVFLGHDFVLTVKHGDTPDLGLVRGRMESDPHLLASGSGAILYAILDAVVDGYAPVVAGLQNDIDEIETEVFQGDATVSRRIYELSREVVEFGRAAKPLLSVLESLARGSDICRVDDELHRHFRDVADHLTMVVDRVDGFQQLLQDILTVNATLVGQAQNEEMRRLSEAGYIQNEEVKKVSAWAAILFAPTLVGTIYGMNFRHMPELYWQIGYPGALALMAAICGCLYLAFRRRGWL